MRSSPSGFRYLHLALYCHVVVLYSGKRRSEMHAARERHDLKWKDERVGQKSSACKQASLTNQSYVQGVGSAPACCQTDQRLKEEEEKGKDKKKHVRHQWHATKHLTRNLEAGDWKISHSTLLQSGRLEPDWDVTDTASVVHDCSPEALSYAVDCVLMVFELRGNGWIHYITMKMFWHFSHYSVASCFFLMTSCQRPREHPAKTFWIKSSSSYHCLIMHPQWKKRKEKGQTSRHFGEFIGPSGLLKPACKDGGWRCPTRNSKCRWKNKQTKNSCSFCRF